MKWRDNTAIYNNSFPEIAVCAVFYVSYGREEFTIKKFKESILQHRKNLQNLRSKPQSEKALGKLQEMTVSI